MLFREDDPLFQMFTPLRGAEKNTTSKKILTLPKAIRKFQAAKKRSKSDNVKSPTQEKLGSEQVKQEKKHICDAKTELTGVVKSQNAPSVPGLTGIGKPVIQSVVPGINKPESQPQVSGSSGINKPELQQSVPQFTGITKPAIKSVVPGLTGLVKPDNQLSTSIKNPAIQPVVPGLTGNLNPGNQTLVPGLTNILKPNSQPSISQGSQQLNNVVPNLPFLNGVVPQLPPPLLSGGMPKPLNGQVSQHLNGQLPQCMNSARKTVKEEYIDLTKDDSCNSSQRSESSVHPTTFAGSGLLPPFNPLSMMNWPLPPLLGGLNGNLPFPPLFMSPLDILTFLTLQGQSQLSSHMTSAICDKCGKPKTSVTGQSGGQTSVCSCSSKTTSRPPPIPPMFPPLGLLPFLPNLPLPGGLLGRPPLPNMGTLSSMQQGVPRSLIHQPKMEVKEGEVQTVLKDHCYLNKVQMQRLSPKSQVAAKSSIGKIVPHHNTQAFSKELPLRDASSMSSIDGHISQRQVRDQLASPQKDLSADCVKNAKKNMSMSVRNLPSQSVENARRDIHHVPERKLSEALARVQSGHQSEQGKQQAKVLLPNVPSVGSKQSVPTKCASATAGRTLSALVERDRTISPESGEPDSEGGDKSRKRKLNRSVSVPGWFGKGLNVRKKRK